MAAPTASPRTTFTDQVSTYQSALRSLFSGRPEETEADLSKLFTPTFTQRSDDGIRDFAGFVAHIRRLREILPEVKLTVTQFLRDGNQLAERHDGVTTQRDGTVLRSETFQFVQVAEDGRIEWIVEAVKRAN